MLALEPVNAFAHRRPRSFSKTFIDMRYQNNSKIGIINEVDPTAKYMPKTDKTTPDKWRTTGVSATRYNRQLLMNRTGWKHMYLPQYCGSLILRLYGKQ